MGFLDTVGQTLSNGLSSPYLIPALATAGQQWQQAGQYQDLGNQAADRADPFGQYRRGYGDQLQGLYNDPSKIADTPGYKFALNQALDSTQSRLRASGQLGSSQMQNALTDQASGMAAQTWNTEANRLAMLSGAQFDPKNAAAMMMEGGKLKMDAQSNALGALMYPFGPGANNINNNNGSSGPGGGNPGSGGSGGAGGAGNTLDQMARQAGPGGILPGSGTVANLWQRFLTSPGSMSPADIHMLDQLGFPTGMDTGGMDTAPGSYDPSGFGGYGSASTDPTLQGIGYGNPNFSVGNYNDVMGGQYGDVPSYAGGDPYFNEGGFTDSAIPGDLYDGGSTFDFGDIWGGL